MLRNGKMCKDKWKGWNSHYKKLLDYHKGASHHTSFQELSTKECNHHHLPWAFNIKAYETIEAFQGEHIINTHVYVRDLRWKGMGIMYQKVTCKKTKTLSICTFFHAITSWQ